MPAGPQDPWESSVCDRGSGLSLPGQLAKGLGFKNSPGPRGTRTIGPKGPTSTIWTGPWGTP